MSKCSRCESLPAGWPEVGILYVSPPLAHTRGTLRRLFWQSGLPFGDPLEDIVAVEVTPKGLKRLCDLLSNGLSEAELEDCSAVLVEKGSTVGRGMLSRMQELGDLVAAVRGEWLLEILREDRITIHFQPIVSVADSNEVFAYECLLRGLNKDGTPVSPGLMFEAARRADLLFHLDRAARTKAIWEAAELELEPYIFVNFDPAAVYDPAYCLKSTLGAIKRSGLSPDRVIFEVTKCEEIQDHKHLQRALDFYREKGFKVSLDDLGQGYDSLKLLDALRPDFVKLDMSSVRDLEPCRAVIASKLLELSRELGVAVVAEGVETEEQWRWLVARGADFAQGYFFAKPDFPVSRQRSATSRQ